MDASWTARSGPAAPASAPIAYELDAWDDIRALSGPWDAFALANGGRAGLARDIRGETLWRFISGADTITYYNAIFFWVRSNQAEFVTVLRCDAPGMKRLDRMTVRPRPASGLSVEFAPIWRRPVGLPARSCAAGATAASIRCSICCRAPGPSGWEEVPAVGPGDPAPRYEICPECRSVGAEALSRASAAQACRRAAI